MEVARRLVEERYIEGRAELLHHWRDGWWHWEGPRWVELEPRAIAAEAYRFTEHAVDVEGKEWAPNRRKVADTLDALAAITHLGAHVEMPAWLDGRDNAGPIVSCANGLLHVPTQKLLPHDPRFFNATSVPFDYDPKADPPARWLAFLGELWPDDAASLSCLAEWFGYVLSGRLDLHKILLLVGPTRAGKGVIARVLIALVGRELAAGPTLASLNGDFGLAPLIGKSIAVVSDARLNGRGQHILVERLLSISGEDTLTVNRKYREQWTGKLPVRFMVCSNELPQLGDASAAIAGRFVPLILTESWYGKEDRDLERQLHAELPGILNWSLDGLKRLTREGRFTHSATADEAIVALGDLASPVSAFVRDRCERNPGQRVEVDALWAAWSAWAEDNGHHRGTKQLLGRNLSAVVPGLRVVRPRRDGQRERVYVGVGLKEMS
jgi:putative DNA primase/helicase